MIAPNCSAALSKFIFVSYNAFITRRLASRSAKAWISSRPSKSSSAAWFFWQMASIASKALRSLRQKTVTRHATRSPAGTALPTTSKAKPPWTMVSGAPLRKSFNTKRMRALFAACVDGPLTY